MTFTVQCIVQGRRKGGREGGREDTGTIDSQLERLAVLQAIQKAASIFHDESTGQGVLCVLVVLYLWFSCVIILSTY